MKACCGTFKWDCVGPACLGTEDAVGRQFPAWVEHDPRQAPHSALGKQSPAEVSADWLVKTAERTIQNYLVQYTRAS